MELGINRKKVKIDNMKTYKVTVSAKGTIKWYNENDESHREDGPAIEWTDGDKWWYLNGKLHREDGPAVEHANGAKYWYLNDKLHREDGPAVEHADGSKEWYINGKYLTEEEFNKRNNKPCIGKKVIIEGIEYTLK
jgi:hypothetical protein